MSSSTGSDDLEAGSGVHDLNEQMMARALQEARRCLSWGDVPIGAVVARGSDVLGAAGNQRERLQDPTAHAEMVAIRQVAERLGSWRLTGCTMWVTLEPCAMCAGALVLARIDRLVFGAADPKAGFAGSLGDITHDPRLNHRVRVDAGARANESSDLLRRFFASKRGV
jgi:tRNA(adenine34) deaminase